MKLNLSGCKSCGAASVVDNNDGEANITRGKITT